MRVFVDTNVWIAALIARGTCSELIEHLIAQHEIGTSDWVVGEVERVLAEKFDYSGERVEEVRAWLGDVCEVVETPDDPAEVSRDRDDDFVLASADEANAEVLVTGDEDLLAVDDEVEVTIVEPAEFWKIG